MFKVVYNVCYGGFGLSDEAIELMAQLGHPLALKAINESDSSFMWQKYYLSDHKLKRHDPILIQVVEKLGEKANSQCAKLRIGHVSGAYRITYHDGLESIEESGNDWIHPLEK